jgi:ribosomal-protein-alanine N-acetyltransferase
MSQRLQLSPIQSSDSEAIAAIAALDRACFGRPWSEATVRSELERVGSCVLTIRDPGFETIAGYIVGFVSVGAAELLRVGVAEPMRGLGLGAKLLDAWLVAVAQAGAREAFLEVAARNHSAYSLYRRRGFEEVARRRGYYPALPACPFPAQRDVDDAIVMRRAF